MSSQQRNLDQEKHDKWVRSQSEATIKQLANNLGALMRDEETPSVTQFESKNSSNAPRESLDAIERAIQKHPGLTRKEALELADYFGF
jgi:hypothetical protein